MLFVFSLFHVYMVWRNVTRGQCPKYAELYRCTEDYILTYSVANFGVEYDRTELVASRDQILALCSIGLFFLSLPLIRYQLKKAEIEVDELTDSVSDYSLSISGLPQDASVESISAFFESNFKDKEGRPIKPIKISKTYYLKEFKKIEDEYEASIREYQKLKAAASLATSPAGDALLERASVAMHDLAVRYNEVEEQVLRPREKNFLGVAYVSFNFMWHADLVYREAKQSRLQFLLGFCSTKFRFVDPQGKSTPR